MAEFNSGGIDELMLSLAEIAEIPEEVQDEMLLAQAAVVQKAQTQSIETFGIVDTRKTLLSVKTGKPKWRKKDGVRVVYITPTGSRRRGGKRGGPPNVTRNAEILFVNEYGKKGQKARPAIQTANEKSAEATTQAALEVYDRWLKNKGL